jgi:hypothetical protein
MIGEYTLFIAYRLSEINFEFELDPSGNEVQMNNKTFVLAIS